MEWNTMQPQIEESEPPLEKSKEKDWFLKGVERQIEFLANSETGQAKAELAELRRGLGKDPGELPTLWGVFLEHLPELDSRKAGWAREHEEQAVYHALTLFALHEQGNSVSAQAILDSGFNVGGACGVLVKKLGEYDQDRIQKRLEYALRSSDIKNLAIRLRPIIQLLKQQGISLNYIQLANDFRYFEYSAGKRRIQMDWARSFFKEMRDGEKNE